MDSDKPDGGSAAREVKPTASIEQTQFPQKGTLEGSLKRTRRIEIVRYTRRITRPLGDDDSAGGADYATDIDIVSMTQGDTRFVPDQTDEVDRQAVDSAARTSPRYRWIWLDWLKRE